MQVWKQNILASSLKTSPLSVHVLQNWSWTAERPHICWGKEVASYVFRIFWPLFVLLTERPSLIFTNRKDVRKIQLDRHTYLTLVDNTSSAIALDYHYDAHHVYWSDVSLEKIQRWAGEKTRNPIRPVCASQWKLFYSIFAVGMGILFRSKNLQPQSLLFCFFTRLLSEMKYL